MPNYHIYLSPPGINEYLCLNISGLGITDVHFSEKEYDEWAFQKLSKTTTKEKLKLSPDFLGLHDFSIHSVLISLSDL